MLTMENTEGFTQKELNVMNAEVDALMGTLENGDCDYYQYLQWAEEKVLKQHGGA